MLPVYSDDQSADQVLDWDHTDPDVLQARKFGGADFGTGAFITYDFMTTDELVDANSDGTERAMTREERTRLLEYMDYLEDVANIVFVRVEHSAEQPAMLQLQARTISLGNAPPTRISRDGDADLLAPVAVTFGEVSGDTFTQTHALHEIMHGLGANHPGDYDGGTSNASYDQVHYFQDSRQYTVMSYWEGWRTGASYDKPGDSALMLHDVMAMQKLYGANENAFSGDTTYGFFSQTGRSVWTVTSDSDPIYGAIWDTGGIDTINMALSAFLADIDLREGRFSSTNGETYNLSISYGAVIENAIGGSADDRLGGNAAVNRLEGRNGDDILIGRGGRDSLFGGIDDDALFGGASADFLDGGDGDDEITGGSGDDQGYGRDGDDLFLSGSGNDSFYGGAGIDRISYASRTYAMSVDLEAIEASRIGGTKIDRLVGIENVTGGMANDVILGDDGVNRLVGREGRDEIRGRRGADELFGGWGADTLYGGRGDDSLYGGENRDEMYGRGGSDLFRGGAGNDVIDGGDGRDTVDYSAESVAWQIDLGAGTGRRGNAETDTLVSIEDVRGGSADDDILGNSAANRIYGGKGNDDIGGRNGDDSLFGGNGNDSISGGYGDDLISGGKGFDRLDGGQGNDTADYSDAARGWRLDLAAELATRNDGFAEAMLNFENAIGGSRNDTLRGDATGNVLTGNGGDDEINGYEGNDTLFGGGGDDILIGHAGDDLVQGGAGNDFMNGAGGRDTVDYGDAAAGWLVDLQTGEAVSGGQTDTLIGFEDANGGSFNDAIAGDSGANRINGRAGNDVLFGRQGADDLSGGDGDDWLYGDNDNDVLSGNTGSDRLAGGAGDDTLYGGNGSDWLYGGAGEDHLIGGFGNDIFIFVEASESVGSTRDLILAGGQGAEAFTLGEDLISLAGIDANALVAGDQAFALHSSPGAGRLVLRDSLTGYTVIEGYIDGDRTADFMLMIEDGTRLASSYSASDFIL